MNTFAVITGFGGILIGFLMLYYTIIILEKREFGTPKEMQSFFRHRQGVRALKLLTIGFGIYAVGMLLGAYGLVQHHPEIDNVSQLLGGASLVSMLYYLRVRAAIA